MGSTGIGIFQLILTVYAMSKTLAYGGMSLASTRLCIDDYESFPRHMRRIFFIAFALGGLAALLLNAFSAIISIRWIMTEDAKLPLQILSLSLPFISVSAALNGYMTAARKMNRYSFIQLAEQIAKIGITVWIFSKEAIDNNKNALSAVCLAITISEVFSFLLALYFYGMDRRKCRQKAGKSLPFLKSFLRIAVPDALGAYARSILNTIEHLLIPKGIYRSGKSIEKALSDYGAVQGMSLPVLLYPSAILGVISGLLIPEIAECKMKKNTVEINYIIYRVLRGSAVFSIFITAVMYVFSEKLSLVIYGNTDAAFYIRLLAPLIPIMYLDMSTDGILKGLDLQLKLMKINMLDSVICVISVAVLVPIFSVDGYIITIYIAEIINFILSFHLLGTNAKIRLSFSQTILMPLMFSFFSLWISSRIFASVEQFVPFLICAIGFGFVFYLIVLRMTNAIQKEEMHWIYKIVRS